MTEEFNGIELYEDDAGGLPLFPPGGCDEDDGEFVFDETGDFVMADRNPVASTQPVLELPHIGIPSLFRACSLTTLNGSWLLHVRPRMHHFLWQRIRGPMRIEAANNILRASGDIYVSRFPVLRTIDPPTHVATVQPMINPTSLVIRKNWYPGYPKNQYKWYFRSTGVRYSKSGNKGTLTFKFVRHLWNAAAEEFTNTDAGWMKFNCTRSLLQSIHLPQPTIEMKGEAMVGGQLYEVTAIKTSPYYRGCQVEVDVMQNRNWPGTSQQCNGSSFSFSGVYRDHGLDFRAIVDQTNIPDDSQLTSAEMHNLLATHRSLATASNQWRLWVLVGSRIDGTLGLMFDGIAPHREGVAGFYDPRFGNSTTTWSNARGQKIGDVPIAFLRTLIHEAGHAFNLYHPKHDCHSVATGTTIMNQTGDVMGFATVQNPYPCNATFGFNEHNRTSLIHSPDPQVKPGWKEFGWGHGGAWCGVPEPTDAFGLDTPETADELRLELDVPVEVFPGELILANFKVTNVGDASVAVSRALNLSEGYLRLYVIDPAGDSGDVGDVLLLCGDGRPMDLNPGESQSGSAQIFYTNRGFKFEQIGRYKLRAELDLLDGSGRVARSSEVQLSVRAAASEQETAIQDITLSEDVGLSLALGDIGTGAATYDKVAKVADEYGDTLTGAAYAMVMVNSLGRQFRDPLEDATLRDVDETAQVHYFNIATKGRSLVESVQMATSVAATRELQAPILQHIHEHIGDQRFKKADRDRAQKVYSDYLGD